jgi:tyrosine-specific transport protein
MNSKLFGGILLIVGTAIGAGMLALPVTTAPGGFLGAALLLISCWIVMTFTAFLILEVNLWLPPDSNLISMAKSTLGCWGEAVAWISFLLFLYSVLSAYVSGGADIIHDLVNSVFRIHISQQLTAIIFLAVMGSIVYQGMQSVDYVNRILMSTKFLALFLLILLMMPLVHSSRLTTLHVQALTPAVSVVVCAFTFALILPSLRSYFNDDVKKLRKAIIIGSAIPLMCYLFWIGVIFGNVPVSGIHGLFAMLTSPDPNSALVGSLQVYLQNSWINTAAHAFTTVALTTSFLGVGITLTDFLADGFKIQKVGNGKIIIALASFVPPLLIALYFPTAFILCLKYAGLFCVILFIIMPALMAWRGRYQLQLANDSHYRVMGGKLSLHLVLALGVLIILQQIMVSI